MQERVYRVIEVLCAVVAGTPIGTNLGLLHLLWMLVSGRLLETRGAVIPGLSATGLSEPAVRRAWAALGQGDWSSAELLGAWREQVEQAGHWQVARVRGVSAGRGGRDRVLAATLAGVRDQPLRRAGRQGAAGDPGRASWHGSGASGRSGWGCRWRWCGRTRPIRARPRMSGRWCRRRCRRPPTPMRWCSTPASRSDSSRPPGRRGTSSGRRRTSRHDGRPCRPTRGTGAHARGAS